MKTLFISLLVVIGGLSAYLGWVDKQAELQRAEFDRRLESMRAELKMATPDSVLNASVWSTLHED